MSEIQSEAALEALLIKTLSKIGYEPVQLLTYEQLVANFRNQIFIHNKERLGCKPLSDAEHIIFNPWISYPNAKRNAIKPEKNSLRKVLRKNSYGRAKSRLKTLNNILKTKKIL
jgi:hypothetical protein